MAITLIKKKQEYTYIPVSEREEKNPVKFIFRLLTKEEKAKLEDKLVLVNNDQTINIANASYLLGAIKIALKKVENLLDENGEQVKIKFIHNQVSDEFLDMLPDEILQELCQVIVSVSKDPVNADIYLGNKKEEDDKQ